jgi:tetratricopeptide (TPR) repeat protein
MAKNYFIPFVFVLSFFIILPTLSGMESVYLSENVSIQNIRLRYYQAVENEKEADKLLDYLNKLNPKTALIEGYTGGVLAIKAKHAWNPYDKLNFLDKADKYLSKAVSKSPNDIEIRFIRFSYEHYVPSFLGRSKHLDDDKKTLLYCIADNKLNSVPPDLLQKIITFLKESKRLSAAELKILP